MRPLHGPDDMECGWLGGWLIDRRLEAFGHRFDEGLDGRSFDEGDRCAYKPGTGHTGAEATLERLALGERRRGMARQQPAWLEGVGISGRQLAVAGVPMQILNPETALLLHLWRR